MGIQCERRPNQMEMEKGSDVVGNAKDFCFHRTVIPMDNCNFEKLETNLSSESTNN